MRVDPFFGIIKDSFNLWHDFLFARFGVYCLSLFLPERLLKRLGIGLKLIQIAFLCISILDVLLQYLIPIPS